MNPDTIETQESPAELTPLAKLVGGTLVRELTTGLGTGELAELRRWSPDQPPSSPTFWRMVVWHLEPAGQFPDDSRHRAQHERRWAALLAAFAALQDLHARGRSLGDALQAAGVSEARLTRLLRAEDDALFDILRAAVHQLASAREPVDWTDLAFLVLSDAWSSDKRHDVRLRIARSYYTAESRSQQKGESA